MENYERSAWTFMVVKGIYLGCYNTPEEASRVYQKAEKEYFGEYAYKGGDMNE